jgi:hypothetical protein
MMLVIHTNNTVKYVQPDSNGITAYWLVELGQSRLERAIL